MSSSIEKLQKFLKLEADRDYDNRAVFGGLEIIAPNWQKEAQSERLDENKVETITTLLKQYPQLKQQERIAAVNDVLQILNSLIKTQSKASSRYNSQKFQNHNRAEKAIISPRRDIPKIKKIHPINKPSKSDDESSNIVAGLESPLTVLPSIGQKGAQIYQKLGLNTLGDLLYYFPRRYDDYSNIKPIYQLNFNDEVTVIATVQNIQNRQIRGGKATITEAIVSDDTGYLRLTWFNQPFITKLLNHGNQIVLSGKINMYLGRLVMNNPEWEPIEKEHLHTNRIVPVYRLTSNISQRSIRSAIFQTVSSWGSRISDYLPDEIIQSQNLVSLSSAITNIHFPETRTQLNAAHQRLAFDEIFLLQLGLLQQKYDWQSKVIPSYSVDNDWLAHQIIKLPFTLTNSQIQVLDEIRQDLASGHPMNRLVQGDVGSGKTIIAALTMLIMTQHNVQAVLMAPTSILADQLYKNITQLLINEIGNDGNLSPEDICLLIGDTPESTKQEIRTGLSQGKIKIVIGTHALIEDPVQFKNLQLVIIDEQHRFGVSQRAALREKGENPHLMVMTATPIPRSLALTIYGDLDLSIINELPAGRKPIITHLLHPLERERAYQLILNQIESGKQAFIIYPFIDQNEDESSISAIEEHKKLQNEVFPKLQIGLLHGRMKPEEKDLIMKNFRDGAYHILVSTSVIEVGVDIPNATVILIEGANRFGLAQLHQFRGRVGRGQVQSYCLLIPENEDSIENKRLSVMCETNDGFILADRDLNHRGPGDFLGTRQSGFMEIKLANFSDISIIEKARKQANIIFQKDPELKNEEHQSLKKMLKRFWINGRGDNS